MLLSSRQKALLPMEGGNCTDSPPLPPTAPPRGTHTTKLEIPLILMSILGWVGYEGCSRKGEVPWRVPVRMVIQAWALGSHS